MSQLDKKEYKNKQQNPYEKKIYKRYEYDEYFNYKDNKIVVILKYVLIILIILLIILKSLLYTGTQYIKKIEYDGISLEQMLDNNYGEGVGRWKSSLHYGNIVTTYKVNDNSVQLEFIGGITDDIKFGKMKIEDKSLNNKEKEEYLMNLVEKYKRDYEMVSLNNEKKTSEKINLSEEKEENYDTYSVDRNLPNAILSNTSNSVDRISRFKQSLFIGSNETIEDIYYNDGYISEGELYDNGYIIYISSENIMGNYTFRIFCDTENSVYYVELVKDKDNGKEFNDNKYINIYLNDVLNRYYGKI